MMYRNTLLLSICLVSQFLVVPSKLLAKINLFPLAFYSPETSVAFGGAITLSSVQKPQNMLSGIAFVTLKGQFKISGNSAFAWDDDKWRAEGDISFKRYPSRLFAIGPLSEDPSDDTKFTQIVLSARFSNQRQIGGWHLGPILNMAFYKSLDVVPDPGQTPADWTGFSRASIFGLGLGALRDRRDHPFDPRSGSYTQITYTQYLGLADSFSRYAEFKFDHRRYFPISSRLSWATAVYFQVSGDDAPYHVLPHFGNQEGGARLMRGYYADRYRDHSLLALQNELRILIGSSWCMQVFADIGQVAPRISAINFSAFRSTFGIGIGFFVDKANRLPIHLEAGFSKEGPTFSFNPMAAF